MKVQSLLRVLRIVWAGLLSPSECWASNKAGKRTRIFVQWSFGCILQLPLAFVPKEDIGFVALGQSAGNSLLGTLVPGEELASGYYPCLTLQDEGGTLYLNSALTTAWSIWKGLGCLWNVLYFLCLKVGDKIPADLLRAEVPSGLMLPRKKGQHQKKKRPHFWPQLHRTWAQMRKTHPNPHSAPVLIFYLLNTREALPNRRHESSQAVSGLILHLDESCRAGGTGGHVPTGVFPASEEWAAIKGIWKDWQGNKPCLPGPRDFCVVSSPSRSVTGVCHHHPKWSCVTLDQTWIFLLNILMWNMRKNLESSMQKMKGLKSKQIGRRTDDQGARRDGERDNL